MKLSEVFLRIVVPVVCASSPRLVLAIDCDVLHAMDAPELQLRMAKKIAQLTKVCLVGLLGQEKHRANNDTQQQTITSMASPHVSCRSSTTSTKRTKT